MGVIVIINTRLRDTIERLKDERNAVILAHNYQIEEVQDVADYIGDSLGLSRRAAQTEAEVIVFCGVDFMAETAAILSPDKTVLLPAREAGCPMAEMVTVEELEKKKREYPEAACVCYVNSSAAVKAASDICCTSSNAVEIVEKLPEEQIIFVPDQNLGHYVAQKTQKEIIQWPGYCITHHRVLARHVREVREHYPDAPILVHPECRPEVVELADFVGSTAQILQEGRRSTAEVLIIGTEMGLLHRLKQENPEKTFYLLDQGLICRNMKFTTLEHIADALEGMQYEITVDEEVRVKARDALDKMLNLS